mmetsp:Transcript_39810/g.119721  ORF Transcript_39810/g.119721 Transcript_39810/m.119721 type:complete len:96 (-) Transcript_39810:628-915(-)
MEPKRACEDDETERGGQINAAQYSSRGCSAARLGRDMESYNVHAADCGSRERRMREPKLARAKVRVRVRMHVKSSQVKSGEARRGEGREEKLKNE